MQGSGLNRRADLQLLHIMTQEVVKDTCPLGHNSMGFQEAINLSYELNKDVEWG